MASETANVAPVKWAERQDSLYLTIALADVTDHTINLTETTLEFSGKSEDKEYACNLEFLHEVETEGSVWNVLPRSIQMKIMKKDKDADEWWGRLLKNKALEKGQVQIDWDKFVDEDEEEAGNDFDTSALDGGMGFGGGMGGMGGMGGGMGGLDMASMMQNMGGMGGGMGDMGDLGDEEGDLGDEEGEDSDDEDLPDLEDA
ncbi:unnamed protein product [Heterosigma akashiwo]|uniref:CS domain-containing protein n=1 Tax=Heterosigma akashiwo TaxID=2829 RepID=A0A6T5R882_HETAK